MVECVLNRCACPEVCEPAGQCINNIPLPAPKPDRYCVVEVMGHRRYVGRVREVTEFGAIMIAIEVPVDGDFDKGFVTHKYAGSALFSIRDVPLQTVIDEHKPYVEPEPPRLLFRRVTCPETGAKCDCASIDPECRDRAA